MRTWKAAERLLRRETGLNVGRLGGHALPLVIAVGGRRPSAVIALGGVDAQDPANTVAELAALATAFRPTRALVALAIPRAVPPAVPQAVPRALHRALHRPDARRTGLLVGCDATLVADGIVAVTRAWSWRRVGHHVAWLPPEVRGWRVGHSFVDRVARTILARRLHINSQRMLDELLTLSVAAGHRVRLAR